MGSYPILFVYFVVFVYSLHSVVIDANTTPNLSFWCNQTPYQKECEDHLRNHKYPLIIKGKSYFLKMMIESAMESAIRTHQIVHSLGIKCNNKTEKDTWKLCLELYEHTIQHLNLTTTTTKSSQADIQTWLSSALTHFQTCEDELSDLPSASKRMKGVFPNSNVSRLISNALAINHYETRTGHGPAGDWPKFKDGFPGWVKSRDRKLLHTSYSLASQANLVVAQDGSGNFKSITEAIIAASKITRSVRFIIYIKAGTYNEYVEIGSGLKNIMFLGDGIGKTIITGSRSARGGFQTYHSATVAVDAHQFIARGITFRNTAGPLNYQAVALRSSSDASVFYQCSFEGYQDTLYVFVSRQFYRECDIYGTVDFIFGNAAVVFQNCNIFARFPPAKINTITAQGRDRLTQPTGISIHNCRLIAAANLSGTRTYLGRPWKQYSTTVFMKTFLDSIVDPQGWLEWDGSFALSTLYYGEYKNTGPGSSTAHRVKWPGYHVITSTTEAEKFSVRNLIKGDSWLPNTTVPFTSGL